MQTFDHSAPFYDALYAARGKSYAQEAGALCTLLRSYGVDSGATLLDVACGTGEHLSRFESIYSVCGVDASEAMLEQACKKLPQMMFSQGCMTDFTWARKFDAITCLFAAIGYVDKAGDLDTAIHNMSRHLESPGVLVIEPALTPEQVKPSETTTESITATIDHEQVTVKRTTSATHEPEVLRIRFDYEITTHKPRPQQHAFSEIHPIRLFHHEQYIRAFQNAGLEPTYFSLDQAGLRLYVGSNVGKK